MNNVNANINIIAREINKNLNYEHTGTQKKKGEDRRDGRELRKSFCVDNEILYS